MRNKFTKSKRIEINDLDNNRSLVVDENSYANIQNFKSTISKKVMHFRVVNFLNKSKVEKVSTDLNPIDKFLLMRNIYSLDKVLDEIELEYKMALFLYNKVKQSDLKHENRR